MHVAPAGNHFINRIGWLRAAVLGANDGIVSTASLIIGVAAAGATQSEVLLVGTAGLVAGAMSMAAGEYVSVSSQADVEAADLVRERGHLDADPVSERQELADIWIGRGLEPELARKVADQLMEHDALAAHARDELGISEAAKARPIQAALSSAASFTAGALLPLAAVIVSSPASIPAITTGSSLSALALLGALSAHIGGAPILNAVVRVMLWGALAMLATALVGHLFGTTMA